MGLTPSELEQYTFAQFEVKCKGFQNFNLDQENYFRKLAYIMVSINTDPKSTKKPELDDIWPTIRSIDKAKDRNAQAESKVQQTLAKFIKKQGS
jgi:hypothetical protein